MQTQMASSSNHNQQMSGQQAAYSTPASARTSTRAGANQRTAQAANQEVKKVEEWAGDCMTNCYNC